jgi:hypothetical protein
LIVTVSVQYRGSVAIPAIIDKAGLCVLVVLTAEMPIQLKDKLKGANKW